MDWKSNRNLGGLGSGCCTWHYGFVYLDWSATGSDCRHFGDHGYLVPGKAQGITKKETGTEMFQIFYFEEPLYFFYFLAGIGIIYGKTEFFYFVAQFIRFFKIFRVASRFTLPYEFGGCGGNLNLPRFFFD